jgi:hypothetical protein
MLWELRIENQHQGGKTKPIYAQSQGGFQDRHIRTDHCGASKKAAKDSIIPGNPGTPRPIINGNSTFLGVKTILLETEWVAMLYRGEHNIFWENVEQRIRIQ